MAKKNKKIKKIKQKRSSVYLTDPGLYDMLCVNGYTRLDKNPEVLTCCRKIADLISTMTIHLMANTAQGDERIINELSRKIDIYPNRYMTRKTFMEMIVMNLLLYGKGNSICLVKTESGYLGDMVPVSPASVSFRPDGYGYKVIVNGQEMDPDSVLHFVDNPDPMYPWMGQGVLASIYDVANNLKQARATENAFMSSKWKPSVIVKVDALIDEFSSPEGRKKLLKDYIETTEEGEPWMIPAEQFSVEQIRPLSIADLAINDTVELEKKTIAAIIGVPAFLLGVGEYDQKEWNNFINTRVKTITTGIQQEMTRKLIMSPKMYLKFNVRSLLDWDLESIYKVFGGLSDKGIATGNEVRDILGMSPLEGLDELRILENYIPNDMIGSQKKLIQEE